MKNLLLLLLLTATCCACAPATLDHSLGQRSARASVEGGVAPQAAEEAINRLISLFESRNSTALRESGIRIYTDALGFVEGNEEFTAFFNELNPGNRPGPLSLLPFKGRRLAVEGDRTLYLLIVVRERVVPADDGAGTNWQLDGTVWLVQFQGSRIVSLRSAPELNRLIRINGDG